MIKTLVLLVAVAAILFEVGATADGKVKHGEIVATKVGRVQGRVSLSRDGREFYQWLGVPYAAPPVGGLRFKATKPVKPWTEIRDATEYGAQCAQINYFGDKKGMGEEDCLFLNVHTPKAVFETAAKTGTLRPVMVWIHGGYLSCGTGQDYEPDYFMDEDVIVVTINYRVSVFGFLSTGDGVIRGNMGLKDQSMALRWVNENIAAFGGNPDQVTVFGESAGGISVHYQVISPMSKGLLHRAISQSGNVFLAPARTENPLEQAQDYAQRVGCPTDSTEALAKCIKSLETSALLEGLRWANPDKKKIDLFLPVVETVLDSETFLPDTPEALYSSGQVSDIPWMTGVTSDEGAFFIPALLTNATHREQVRQNWEIFVDSHLFLSAEHKKQHLRALRNFYFGGPENDHVEPSEPQVLQNYIKIVSDSFYFRYLPKSIKTHSKVSNVYPYWYSKTGPTIVDVMIGGRSEKHGYLGVAHFDECIMQFKYAGLFDVPKDGAHYDFSKDFVRTWVQFAKGERPVFRGTQLPEVSSATPQLTYLNIADEPEIIDFPHPERYSLWNSLGLTGNTPNTLKSEL